MASKRLRTGAGDVAGMLGGATPALAAFSPRYLLVTMPAMRAGIGLGLLASGS